MIDRQLSSLAIRLNAFSAKLPGQLAPQCTDHRATRPRCRIPRRNLVPAKYHAVHFRQALRTASPPRTLFKSGKQFLFVLTEQVCRAEQLSNVCWRTCVKPGRLRQDARRRLCSAVPRSVTELHVHSCHLQTKTHKRLRDAVGRRDLRSEHS
jgi:hypothetical protein